jgi:predicted O-linked N-acetylglucosamine transferase (SPINDLY family)
MKQLTIDQALQIALGHHQAGRLAEAEGIYRQILARCPDHADALHLLGVLAGQLGHLDTAIALISRAIVLNPYAPEYHANLGEPYRKAGQTERAVASIRRAVELKPDYAEAHNNLGITLFENGRLDEAITAFTRATQVKRDFAHAHNNRGSTLRELGRLEEAIAAYRQAVQHKPDYAEAYNNLGIALNDAGRLDEAMAAFRRTIELRPDHAEANNNLGVALNDKGERDEAIACYHRAIAIRPDYAEAHNNLGIALWGGGRLDEAIAAYRRAIEIQPDLAEAHSNLGTVYKDQGRINEAIDCFRRAVALRPDFSKAASNVVSTLNYHPDYDAQAILEEHRRWARQFAEPLAGQIGPHQNDRTPDRRLRIGYVSPDFRNHPVGQTLLPLFTHRDRRQFEIVCYCDVRAVDPVTEQLKALADEWYPTVGLSDEQLADRVRGDRIDILVDLALHTAANRMLVFARKPAPVQVTAFGMPATTGLATIDYRLTDPYLDPPGATDGDYSERSIRLPHCFWCYEPPGDTPPVGELPAWKNDFLTFGCLNQFVKVSRPALELWSSVLHAVPGARLVLQCQSGSHRDDVLALFEAKGITRDRVEFVGKLPQLEYFALYNAVDLSLDPFPYNGHTSSLDSLWMGVPVITLAGPTGAGRGGVSILSNAGLTELIARTPQQYIELAVQWATDWPRLSRLRAELRPRMQASPLMDGVQFAADVEAALRRMWQTWCGS